MSAHSSNSSPHGDDAEAYDNEDGHSNQEGSFSSAAATAPHQQQQKRQKAAFDMVSNPANNNAVRFDEDGTAVEIIDVSAFSDHVLPRYFKHKNISSFIRQMNMYGFEKIDGSEGAIHTFKHEFFKRDQPALLAKILRKPVKAHRKAGDEDGEESVGEAVETKRFEAVNQAADELTKLKQAQAKHEERLRALENENQHLTEENQRIKGAMIQVKSAQAAMTDRLRRLFMYFMRHYVRDEKSFEETVRNLLENANASPDGGPLAITEPQRQVINSLFKLEDDPTIQSIMKGLPVSTAAPTTTTTTTTAMGAGGPVGDGVSGDEELARSHSLASPWDVQPIVLPIKPRLDDSMGNSDYFNLARDLAQHIDQNDLTLRRIDTLASELQGVEGLDDDDLLGDSMLRLPSTTSISGPLRDDEDDNTLKRS